ncbi:hypothetical protein Poly59_28680 [Rubripirellula reticaptiva]|uniref:Uncharacterized protein n=1 Tax=Rubripirellula reticaptiva TaxID=2528013 RepID=A0A5C6EUJ1_9BACT|nr:hypothetical protein Poly59_28680 [Rubripirellula reticaptiva]
MKSQNDRETRTSQVILHQGTVRAVAMNSTPHGTMPRLAQYVSVEGTAFNAGESFQLLDCNTTRNRNK